VKNEEGINDDNGGRGGYDMPTNRTGWNHTT
jgi:hypothetical protein